jgi:DNA sulfur modification protein DndE
MKPPVETIRISSRSREILIKIKRNTGIERWNEICRVAFCHSLSNPSRPPKSQKGWDTAIEIEWKTFAGEISEPLTSAFLFRAEKDGIETQQREKLSDYFRSHMERGISSIQNTKNVALYANSLTDSTVS